MKTTLETVSIKAQACGGDGRWGNRSKINSLLAQTNSCPQECPDKERSKLGGFFLQRSTFKLNIPGRKTKKHAGISSSWLVSPLLRSTHKVNSLKFGFFYTSLDLSSFNFTSDDFTIGNRKLVSCEYCPAWKLNHCFWLVGMRVLSSVGKTKEWVTN